MASLSVLYVTNRSANITSFPQTSHPTRSRALADGRRVFVIGVELLFREAVSRMSAASHQVLEKAGVSIDDVALVALWEARDQGRIKPGDLVLLTAFGAGFHWAAVLLRFQAARGQKPA